MSEDGLFRLDGKVAVITGAGSGIGRSIALLFAGRGASVAIIDVDGEAAAAVTAEAQALGADAAFLTCDVIESSQVEAAFEAIRRQFGHLAVLVNSAGVGHVGSATETCEDDFDRLYEINVKGVYLCTKAALPVMMAAGGGVILNLSSIAALIGVAERFAYSMTKGAVLAMTKSVAIDYMDHNVRCNCICPARVHTALVDGFLRKNYPGREGEMMQRMAAYQPIGRMARPEEVAYLALYLCCDESAFITGQAVPLDGGVLLV